jgi:integrase
VSAAWQERNPVDRVSFGRMVDAREKRLLTADEHARLMAAMPVAGRLAIVLARYTGMRVSEIRGLRWSDIDHRAGVLHVRRRKSYGDVDEPKSAAGRRTIPLGRLAGLLVRPDGAGPDDYVIRLADTVLNEYLREAARAAGVWWRGFGWHTFRREYLTRLQEQGASAIEAARAAGHSRVDQTAEYTLVGRARQEELALRLQESLDLTWLEGPGRVM